MLSQNVGLCGARYMLESNDVKLRTAMSSVVPGLGLGMLHACVESPRCQHRARPKQGPRHLCGLRSHRP